MENYSIRHHLDKPVVLIGMMGAGKTTTGNLLAKELSCPFIDLDSEIESRTRVKISEFFIRYGEKSFRQKEIEVLSEILENPDIDTFPVIAAGGGIITYKKSFQYLQEKTLTIWLKTDLELLFKRIKTETHRPLLHASNLQPGENPKERLYKLLEQRSPLYRQADLVIQIQKAPPEEVTEKILTQLKSKKSCTDKKR